MLASVALVLATGSAVNSSPVHDTALLLNDNISQSDDEHTDQESHSHKCHGLVSCEIQNETPPFKQMKSRVTTTELFVRSLSKKSKKSWKIYARFCPSGRRILTMLNH